MLIEELIDVSVDDMVVETVLLNVVHSRSVPGVVVVLFVLRIGLCWMGAGTKTPGDSVP